MFRNLVAAGAALFFAIAAVPAQAVEYFPATWSDLVVVDKDDVGLNFVIDFQGKANGAYTSKLSALGDFTFNGVTNGGKTFNFNYSLTNDSIYDSRIRAFGFDTGPVNPTSVDGQTGFTFEYQNVSFVEGVGTMDVCLAAGSGCTQHATGGINDGSTMNGTFALTFANAMEQIDFNNFALKFLSVNPTVGGQDWGAGLGTLQSLTHGAGANPIAAPEPGTWLMMLAGFGSIGFAMRRRTSRQLQLQTA